MRALQKVVISETPDLPNISHFTIFIYMLTTTSGAVDTSITIVAEHKVYRIYEFALFTTQHDRAIEAAK